MENEETDEPIAVALYELVSVQAGARTADALLLDALLIGLCRSLPPLAAEVEKVLQDLAAMPRELEPQAQRSFDGQLAGHLSNLAALVRLANTR